MIKPGDELENPATGERLVFRKTAAETQGAAVVVETRLRPYASGTRDHVHPLQEERFEILRGSVGLRLGHERVVAGPGARFTVPAGTPHRLWNAGDEEACVLSEIRPALRFEQLVASVCALERDADGRANRLRMAVVAHAHRDTARAATARLCLGLGLAARLGRLLGYRPAYDDATSTRTTKEEQR